MLTHGIVLAGKVALDAVVNRIDRRPARTPHTSYVAHLDAHHALASSRIVIMWHWSTLSFVSSPIVQDVHIM